MSEGPPVDDPDDGGEGTDDADDRDPFADFDLEDLDDADPWAELDAGDDGEVDGDLFERLAEENPTRQIEPEVHVDGESAVVPKSKYCQRCEYFSAPPEVSCGHPGTTIAEVVDADSFRVENCPVVAERHGTSDVLDVE